MEDAVSSTHCCAPYCEPRECGCCAFMAGHKRDCPDNPAQAIRRLREKRGEKPDAQEHIDFLTGKRTHDE
jgi:hypothetical protein